MGFGPCRTSACAVPFAPQIREARQGTQVLYYVEVLATEAEHRECWVVEKES